jgi:prepilin-type processing-associated H-X9-DG protein
MPESDPNVVPEPLDYASPGGRQKAANRGRPILLAIIITTVFALLFMTFAWAPDRPTVQAVNRVKSASNLRQIGQAILQYTQDFKGQYPDSFGTILLNEDVTSSVFVSPSRSETPAQGPTTQAAADQLADSAHVSYVYLGRGLTSSTAKPEDIVAYERPVDPNGGANVLFGDGHAEFIDGILIGKIAGRAASGIWPVTMSSN